MKTIRGFSDFGFSYVYVIFEDGTDLYWARSRVLEYLSKIQGKLPEGVKTELGPDATSVGWVFQYALVDRSGKNSTEELRSYQDWFLRYAVQSVPGVAEVATVGGSQKQYQVTVDPNTLSAYGVSLEAVADAIRKSNNEVGGRLLEFSGREYMVRGPRLHQGRRRHREDRREDERERDPGHHPRRRHGLARAGHPPRHRRPRRRRGRRRRHRRHAQRRERPRTSSSG